MRKRAIYLGAAMLACFLCGQLLGALIFAHKNQAGGSVDGTKGDSRMLTALNPRGEMTRSPLRELNREAAAGDRGYLTALADMELAGVEQLALELGGRYSSELNEGLYQCALRRWADLDAPGMLDAALGAKTARWRHDRRLSLQYYAARALGRSQPENGVRKIEAEVAGRDRLLCDHLLAKVFEEFASTDPAAASRLMREMGLLTNDVVLSRSVLRAAMKKWMADDADAALAFVATMPEGETRDSALIAVMVRTRRESLQERFAWLGEIDSDGARRAMNLLVAGAFKHPDFLLQVANDPEVSNQVRNQAIATLSRSYLKEDADMAVEWAAQLGDYDAIRAAGQVLVGRLGSRGDVARFGRLLDSTPAALRGEFVSRFAERLLYEEDGDKLVGWVRTLSGLDQRHALEALEQGGVPGKIWSRITAGIE